MGEERASGVLSAVDRREVEDFLYLEAAYIDERRFDAWLDLFTDDAYYWVPANANDVDPNAHVSIIYDDHDRIAERVYRLQSGNAYGQVPPSKTRHLITNVRVLEGDGRTTMVSSNFLIVELRLGVKAIYSGRYEHHLERNGSSWKMKMKKVELLDNDESLGNLTFLL
jgi:3-phenylpropionate/cinnamic acid dioxygenase small subunit